MLGPQLWLATFDSLFVEHLGVAIAVNVDLGCYLRHGLPAMGGSTSVHSALVDVC